MTDGEKPTEILRHEHENVLEKLDALDGVIGYLGRDEVSGKLRELASFFATDFWVHFTKEEEALFPEIEKFMPRDSGPIGVMLAEHEDLRHTNAELQQAIDAYLKDSGNSEARGTIQGQGTHFVAVLRDHIDKENNILFMIAEMHLGKTQQDRVIELFHKIEQTG